MIRLLISAFVMLTALPAYTIDIERVTSPKGIDAWLVEDHSLPFTAITFMFRGGTSLDQEDKGGAINLMTSLLAEGSGDRDALAFAQQAESQGLALQFQTNLDAIIVNLYTLTENRDKDASLLHDALSWCRCLEVTAPDKHDRRHRG